MAEFARAEGDFRQLLYGSNNYDARCAFLNEFAGSRSEGRRDIFAKEFDPRSARLPVLEIVAPDDKSSTGAEKPVRVDPGLNKIQDLINKNLPELVPDEKERAQFARKLEDERERGEFGPATQELFARLIKHYESKVVPIAIVGCNNLNLSIPPNLPVEVVGRPQDGIKPSTEEIVCAAKEGRLKLLIDATPYGVRRFNELMGTLETAESQISRQSTDRKFDVVRKEIDSLVRQGNIPPGWLPKEGMDTADKQGWIFAVSETYSLFAETRRLILLAAQLERDKELKVPGYKSQVVLPPGVRIINDGFGNPVDVDFGNWVPQTITPGSAENSQKLLRIKVLNQQLRDELEPLAPQVLMPMLEHLDHIPGYGQVPIEGFVDTKTGRVVFGSKKPANSGDWHHFNQLDLRLTLKDGPADAFHNRSVKVIPVYEYREIAPHNPWGVVPQVVYRREREEEAKTYSPGELVAVQTGPGSVEFINARNLHGWLTEREVLYWSGKTFTIGADIAMVATGTIELKLGREAAALAIDSATNEARILGPELIARVYQAPLVSRVKSGSKIAIGLTGMLNNAGANETDLRYLIEARSAYFTVQAFYGVGKFGVSKLTKLSEAPPEGLGRGCGSIRNAERTLEQWQVKALEDAGVPLKTAHFLSESTLNAANTGFVGLTLWELANSPPDTRGLLSGRLEQSKLSERKDVINLLVLSQQSDDIKLRNDLNAYAKSVGIDPDKDPEAKKMIDRVVELSRPDVPIEKRRECIKEFMAYVCPSGAAIERAFDAKGVRPCEEECEPGRLMNDRCDSKKKKLAAMCILLLGRQEDGKYPEILGERTIVVPPITRPGFKGAVHVISPETTVTQHLGTKYLFRILAEDYADTQNAEDRANKSAALVRSGIISPRTRADILLQQIAGADGPDSKAREIAELARLIQLLRAVDSEKSYARDPKDVIKLASERSGLSSRELLVRMFEVADSLPEGDRKATMLFAAQWLKRRQPYDEVDKQRFNEIFLSEKPGLSWQKFKEQREADLMSIPTTPAGWERKVLAAEAVLRENAGGKPDQRAIDALWQCLEKAPPEVRIAAWRLFLQELTNPPDGLPRGTRLIDYLGPEAKQKLAELAPKILDDMRTAPSRPLQEQIAYDRARIEFIEISAPYFRELAQEMRNEQDPIKKMEKLHLLNRYILSLCECTNPKNTEYLEVRAAAVLALGNLGVTQEFMVKRLNECVAWRQEPSPTVRIAAVKSLDRMAIPYNERVQILARVALQDPDAAVRDQCVKFRRCTGSINDAGSEASRARVAEYRDLQNKPLFDEKEVREWLDKNHPRLLKKREIIGYFDAEKYKLPLSNDHIIGRSRTYKEIWDEYGKPKSTRGAMYDPAYMPGLEIYFQNAAYGSYEKEIDDLFRQANNGDKQACRALFYLLKESRMGKAFYMKRKRGDVGLAEGEDDDIYESYTRDEVSGRIITANKVGDRNANQPGQFGEKPWTRFQVFDRDPWPQMQSYIVDRVCDLIANGSFDRNIDETVDLTLQLLLTKDPMGAHVSDVDRVKLVKALDQLLSRPDCSPELRRKVLIKVNAY